MRIKTILFNLQCGEGGARVAAGGLALFVAVAGLSACDDDPEPGDTASTASATTGTPDDTTGSAEESTTDDPEPETGGAATETGEGLDCSDATDAASCAMAMNEGEGGGCTWLAFQNLTIDEAGACDFTDANAGTCVGTEGLDDGCNSGGVCDDFREVYYQPDGDGWRIAMGTACRGASGFELCEDTDAAPCTCACEVP